MFVLVCQLPKMGCLLTAFTAASRPCRPFCRSGPVLKSGREHRRHSVGGHGPWSWQEWWRSL